MGTVADYADYADSPTIPKYDVGSPLLPVNLDLLGSSFQVIGRGNDLLTRIRALNAVIQLALLIIQ